MATFKRYTGTAWEHVSLPLNVGMSPQTLAYVETTTLAQSITNAAGKVDLTGLSVTVTVPAGRRIRIRGWAYVNTDTANARSAMYILEGATQFQGGFVHHSSAAVNTTISAEVIISPSAGSHTYKLQGSSSVGTSLFGGGPDHPAYILVEDITGSTLPYQPASVPVGVLAQALQPSSHTGLTTALVDITGLSVNISVPAGRTLRIRGHVIALQGTAVENKVSVYIMEGATRLGFAEQALNPTVGTSSTVDPECVISPSEGAHTYKLAGQFSAGSSNQFYQDTANGQRCYITVEDITPTPAPSEGAPGSTLAYAQATANQGFITTEADLTELSATVSVPAGRRLRLSAHSYPHSSVAADEATLRIKEGTTQLTQTSVTLGTVNRAYALDASVVITPTAGTHTYKLTMQRSNGTGNVTNNASATFPAFILVEDITGSVWPEGSPVSLGLLPTVPHCRAYHSANQSIPHHSETTLSFNNERFDSENMHDNSTLNSRITIQTAGLYTISFTGMFTAAADYQRVYSIIRMNGSTILAISPGTAVTSGAGGTGTAVTTIYRFAAGDYIEVRVYQANAASAARNLETFGNFSPELAVAWMGP